MTKTKNLYARRYDLDWLRVLAIILVLYFHVGMFFTSWEWHVKNTETSRLIDCILAFLHQWRMPLLLFISGAGTVFASARRNKKQFMAERHKKLLIPLIFSMFVIVPPQIYIEKINEFASYLVFYKTVFELIPYPMGSFSWHHMWFVLYLLLYSVLAVPLIWYLKSENSNRFLSKIEKYFSHKWGFISFVLPMILSQVILRPFFPEETHALIDDWAYFVFYFAFFLGGIVVASSDKLWAILKEQRRFHLGIGLATLVLLEFFMLVPWQSLQPYFKIDVDIIWQLNKIVLAWSWVIAVVGYGQKYLNKNHPWLQRLNEGIYPFYILHQTVIVVLAYPMVNWQAGIAMKFLVLSTISLLVTVGIYWIFVRPFNFMRLLFGMKMKNSVKTVHQQKQVSNLINI
ncbi:MAG: acyltransferase [Calditrichaeota bacterium]|nr:MAG: acyltransferase [Calditrichota bacterium]